MRDTKTFPASKSGKKDIFNTFWYCNRSCLSIKNISSQFLNFPLNSILLLKNCQNIRILKIGFFRACVTNKYIFGRVIGDFLFIVLRKR